VINDKSQDNKATHLRHGGLFSYHFTMYSLQSFVVKKIKIGESFAKLLAKRLIVSCALFALQCPAKKERTGQITMMNRNFFALFMVLCRFVTSISTNIKLTVIFLRRFQWLSLMLQFAVLIA